MSDNEKNRTSDQEDDLNFSLDTDDPLVLADGLPIKEVFGSAENIATLGAPSENAENVHLRYYFHPTWRYHLFLLIGFFIFSAVSISLSHYWPEALVIKGKLFAIGGTQYFLHLPLLVFIPGFLLGKVLLSMYDAKYIIDEGGVEAQIGLVSLNLRQPRLRWEDIRGVEPNQTIWERILGIGSVLIGSAMTNEVEIVMEGVANPRAIQLLIGSERDRRMRELQALGRGVGATGTD